MTLEIKKERRFGKILLGVILFHAVFLFYHTTSLEFINYSKNLLRGSSLRVKIESRKSKKVYQVVSNNMNGEKKVTPENKKITENHSGEREQKSSGQDSALAKYLSELREFITQKQEYPIMAKRLQQEGTITVKFTVQSDGTIYGIKVLRQSPYEILNQEALRMILKVKSFRRFPKELTHFKIEVIFPIEFELS